MLTIFPPTNLEELKTAIKNIWESIPVTICQNIIDNMKERWKLCLMHKGRRRLYKELLRKIRPNTKYINWTVKKSSITGIRVSYNDKFVMRLKARDLKEKNRKIKEKKEIENEAKRKYEYLMKLNPK